MKKRNHMVGNSMLPPRYAAGTLAKANGHSSDQEKCPARANCHVATAETRRFNANASGRIDSGATCANAMIAR